MFILILQLLEVGLQLWLSKEKTKYIDRKMDLQRRYYEEMAKPQADRSDVVLDNLEFELKILSIAFMSETKKVIE